MALKSIIVDDEPLAREAMELLVSEHGGIELSGKFNSAASAAAFMEDNAVDLIFLDINMPGVTGIEFAKTIPKPTLVIFTTAYAEYALEGYEVDAVGYLVKPVLREKFDLAVDKAISYHELLRTGEKTDPARVEGDHFFVKSDRRYHKVRFPDILFIEGLKDYIIIQMADQKLITKMTIKAVSEILPAGLFLRVNRSYIVNLDKIDSFDMNDLFIGKHEIAVGASYRDDFIRRFFPGRL